MSIFTQIPGPTSGGSGTGTDHHSGYYEVITGETITISARKQMTCFGPFINDGVVLVDGILILEP